MLMLSHFDCLYVSPDVFMSTLQTLARMLAERVQDQPLKQTPRID